MALKMPSVMPSQHSFSMVPKAQIERSVFDRSHGYKTTFNAGYLIPFFLDDVLPGDTFSLKAHLLCRLSTPFKPIMDNMFVIKIIIRAILYTSPSGQSAKPYKKMPVRPYIWKLIKLGFMNFLAANEW